MEVLGQCHCGNIAFTLLYPGAVTDIPVRACSCSFCVKHGGAWTSNREARLEVTIQDRAGVEVYRFGTKTAKFHVCRMCGVVPLVTSQLDGTTYAVVNVNTFEGVDTALLRRSAVSFEGEGVGDRLERRKRNWIPDVRISGPGA